MKFSAWISGLLLALILIFSVSKASFAQNQLQQNPNQETSAVQNSTKNIHLWTQHVMLEVISAITCQLAGIDPINTSQQCLGIDRQTGKIGFVKSGGGAIGFAGNLITSTFAIPVHFSDYVLYTASNFGVEEKAYAQGIGFTGLKPVLGLFITFRNLAYLLMVFVFVVIGVAIMLRVRIDPRTIMTIQNQIPKLVIGLIMITLSYAIAGFLIDIMWVSTYFVISIVAPADLQQTVSGQLTLSAPGFANDLFGGGGGGLLGLSTQGAASVGDLIYNLFNSNNVQQSLVASHDCFLICFDIGDIIMGAIAGLLGVVAGVIGFFVFAIAILVALFKLWFALLKCFINILLAVILAPFWIMAGLLPGASPSVGWSGWLKNLVGNLAPFPAVVFMFLVARTIMISVTTSGATAFNPPLLGNITGDNATIYAALIAIGFILASPGVVEQVKKAFGAGEGAGFGGTAVGIAAAGAMGGAVGGRLYRRDQRTGELKGAIGSRVQSFSLGKYNERTGEFAPSRVRSIVGSIAKAPSLRDLDSSKSSSERLREDAAAKAAKKSGGSGGTSSTPPPATP